MALDSNKEKFNILNFINSYIFIVCRNRNEKLKKFLKDFNIKISSSAEGCNGLFGIKNNLNIQTNSSVRGCINFFGVDVNSDIKSINSSVKCYVGFFGADINSNIGPINSRAVGLIIQE